MTQCDISAHPERNHQGVVVLKTTAFFSLLASIAVAMILHSSTGVANDEALTETNSLQATEFEESTSSVEYAAVSPANSENSWKELRPDIQRGLAWLLRATSTADTKNNYWFLNWYFRYYCHSRSKEMWAGLRSCAPKSPSYNSVYPEFRYNQMSLDGRVGSACIFSQIQQELNPRELEVIYKNLNLRYADQTGSMGFDLINGRSSFNELLTMFEGAPYSTAYCAGSEVHWYCEEIGDKRTWGIRSTRHGHGLHWLQTGEVGNSPLYVHIDYYNPGAHTYNPIVYMERAETHIYHDYKHWRDRTLKELVDSQNGHCGIGNQDYREAMSSAE